MITIFVIIYYVIGGIYYGAKYFEDAFSHREVTRQNVFRIGLAGELYAVFWPILIVYYVISRLMKNVVSADKLIKDTITYIFYPLRLIEYINEQLNNSDEEDE